MTKEIIAKNPILENVSTTINIDIGIKISGELYIVTKLKAKHRLIVLDKMLYFLDSDLKLDHYTIFNIE